MQLHIYIFREIHIHMRELNHTFMQTYICEYVYMSVCAYGFLYTPDFMCKTRQLAKSHDYKSSMK